MNKINIAFICDNNYALPARTAVNSIIKNKNADSFINIYIIGVELSAENITHFQKFSDKDVRIQLIEKANIYQNVGLGHIYVSKAALFKFALADIIPEDKVLYLDDDIVVEQSLTDFYNTDISQYYAAVISDLFAEKWGDNKRLNHKKYFNSGVMLLNLKKLREDDIPAKLQKKKKNATEDKYMDQDALNKVFAENVKFMPIQFNYLNAYDETNTSIFKENILNIVVRHYASYAHLKPWNNINATNSELWLQYVLPEDLGCVLKNYFHNLNIDELQNINENIKQLSYENKRLNEKIKKMQKSKISARCKRLLKKLFYKNKNNKKKFRLFGIPLFSLKKQPGKKVFKILGLKFSFKDKVDKWGGVNQWLNRFRDVLTDKKSGYLFINKYRLDKKMAIFYQKGINPSKTRKPQLIVSLTSFPERMSDIHYCLYSLLKQRTKPDKIILWLAKEQFPNLEKDIPQKVLKLKRNGLSIEWCNDLKSYKKLVPALIKYPDDIIVTADDDIYYPSDWLKTLYSAYLSNPEYIQGLRIHKINLNKDVFPQDYENWDRCIVSDNADFLNFFTGAGGVLYPPHSLYKDATEEKRFMQICPFADDIWFWAMAVLNGTKIHKVKSKRQKLIYVNLNRELGKTDEYVLSKINCNQHKNNEQLKNLLHLYDFHKVFNFSSEKYWETRYSSSGNSGAGSYGRLAQFKADVINDFIKQKNIKNIIEFGVGDGNQLSLLNAKNYLGFDVSETIVNKNIERFKNFSGYKFKLVNEFNDEKADLVLSLDVIYHLVEDEVYFQYMENLFRASKRYIIIYSSNKDEIHTTHVKHRHFTSFIEQNHKEWTLIKKIPNKYPYDEKNPGNTSFADFYIYERDKNEK